MFIVTEYAALNYLIEPFINTQCLLTKYLTMRKVQMQAAR